MKILLFSRYSRIGSSSRLRLLQYVPYLQSQGIDVSYSPLLGDDYLSAIYAGNRPRSRSIASTYWQRLRALSASRRYDLLWIEKELFPGLPAWFEYLVTLLGVPYVVDYDDATFYRYSTHRSPLVRNLLGNKIEKVMRRASLVIAGNRCIAERAWQAGARRIVVIPTVVDLAGYRLDLNCRRSEVFTIGWIGSPFTAKYLSMMQPALKELCAGGAARLVAVGSGQINLEGVRTEVRPWFEATEADDVRSFDVGIMPLVDEPWERGKCGYKLIQYMACGKPVVASPVGVNKEIVRDGLTGFLAETSADWVRTLSILRSDPEMSANMGRRGREMVETYYSTQVTAPRICSLLCNAAVFGPR